MSATADPVKFEWRKHAIVIRPAWHFDMDGSCFDEFRFFVDGEEVRPYDYFDDEGKGREQDWLELTCEEFSVRGFGHYGHQMFSEELLAMLEETLEAHVKTKQEAA